MRFVGEPAFHSNNVAFLGSKFKKWTTFTKHRWSHHASMKTGMPRDSVPLLGSKKSSEKLPGSLFGCFYIHFLNKSPNKRKMKQETNLTPHRPMKLLVSGDWPMPLWTSATSTKLFWFCTKCIFDSRSIGDCKGHSSCTNLRAAQMMFSPLDVCFSSLSGVFFTPICPNDPILTNIFQMAWNHQLDAFFFLIWVLFVTAVARFHHQISCVMFWLQAPSRLPKVIFTAVPPVTSVLMCWKIWHATRVTHTEKSTSGLLICWFGEVEECDFGHSNHLWTKRCYWFRSNGIYGFFSWWTVEGGTGKRPLIMTKDMSFLAFKKWVCKMMTPQKNDCDWVYWAVFTVTWESFDGELCRSRRIESRFQKNTDKHKDNQKKWRNLLLSSEKRTIRCFCCMKKLIYLSFLYSVLRFPHIFLCRSFSEIAFEIENLTRASPDMASLVFEHGSITKSHVSPVICWEGMCRWAHKIGPNFGSSLQESVWYTYSVSYTMICMWFTYDI